MADRATLLKAAEDRIALWFSGGQCGTKHAATSEHCDKPQWQPATQLEKLVLLRMLRLDMPHQSSHPNAIEAEIRNELKRLAPKAAD